MSLAGIDDAPGRPLAAGLAWAALLALACWVWHACRDAARQHLAPPAAAELALLFMLWTGLCAGLMLPPAAGALRVYLRVARRRVQVARPRLAAALFALGCLLALAGFAALVTLLHGALYLAGLLDPALAAVHPIPGLTLVAAGAWQWTPAKHACLHHCRAPLPGLLADWQDGARPFWQGAEHARQCLGCCWLLVLLVLAGGPGNPAIVAAVALLALAEWRLAGGPLAACAAGLGMVALGTLLLFP